MKFLKIITVTFLVCTVFIVAWRNLFISSIEYDLESFETIIITGSPEVFLSQGSQESVRVRTENGLHEVVIPEVIDGKLLICASGCSGSERVLEIHVTAPDISKLEISGPSTFTSRGMFKFNSLDLYVSGASETRLFAQCDVLNLEMNGAANVRLAGNAGEFNLTISHVGDLMAYNLEAEEAYVNIDTGPQSPGVARINVQRRLDVRIKGPRRLKVKGKPELIGEELSDEAELVFVKR